jgi:hypothetical protein
MLTRCLLLVLAATCTVVLPGCRDAKISSYRIPKEAPPRPVTAASMPAADTPQLSWKAPADWQQQPASSVRVGSFVITTPDGRKADMAITQFPGNVGGDLANVNRWRGQLQLGPIAEADLEKHVQTLDLPLGKFLLTNLASEAAILEGDQHARILGAWLKQPERTWFFKMAGEAKLVESQREAFLAFLRTVEFLPAGHSADDGHDHSTHNHAAAPASQAPAPQGALRWSAPAEWTPKPLGQMRKGSFALKGSQGGEADFSITSFPGDAGGLLENVNRWRGQIQLPPLKTAELETASTGLTSGDLKFTIVDYKGTGAEPTRLLGAVLPYAGETYFFKVVGPDAVVEQHKAAFTEFLKSVKAP